MLLHSHRVILTLLASLLVAFVCRSLVAADEGESGVPQWIWVDGPVSDGQVVYFRKEFIVEGDVSKANLFATCDNKMELFVNGEKVAQSGAWEQPVKKDLAPQLQAGRNVIAVRGENEGSVAAMVLKLEITGADGSKQTIVTDSSWLASAEEAQGWETVAFKGDGWKKSARIAELGDAPWGDVTTVPPPGEATTADAIQLPPGFRAERLYSVPREQGSWVSMTFDPKGRIIACDQGGPLYRVTLPTEAGGEVQVEKLDVAIGEAQGLLCEFDSLYVVVNGGAAQGSGLYRVTDTNSDDQYDNVELLKKLEGGGEHGPHAVIKGPDDQLYVVAGNFTQIPEGSDQNAPHRDWAEDLLLARLPDGGGHDPHIMAPGGWVARTDKDGKNWTLLAAGLRNSYDIDFNQDGELFTFDSDMEWDTGSTWYRPTRVNHVVSGGEYGWRNGSGKWPAYYPDSLPGYDVGYGSPTGVVFGTGAKFPAKYQRAFFALDWAYGKIYAMHFTPSGSSYTATFEPFVVGKPLPVTDIEIGPDGAMYFTIGGRGTQSGLYRVTYEGDEPTTFSEEVQAAPLTDEMFSSDILKPEIDAREARALRHKLESFHLKEDPAAVEFAWPYLDSEDRFIRYAARVAIEHQDPKLWQEKALAETRPTAMINALVALTRVGDKGLQSQVSDALGRLQLSSLSEERVLEALRVYGLCFIRMGQPDAAAAKKVIQRLDPLFPSPSERVNRELSQLLVYLNSPTVVDKSMKLLATALTQEDQLHYVLILRLMKEGWTLDQRKAYFSWIHLAEDTFNGGHSFKPFLVNVRNDAIATLTEEEKQQLQDVLEKRHAVAVVQETKPRQYVHNWQMEDFEGILADAEKGRDYESGRAAFAAAQCLQCHRFNGEGANRGPDISGVGNRFTARDVLESIIHPSKVVSDQYQNTRIVTKNDVFVGRIEAEDDQKISIRTHPLAPAPVEVKKADVKDRRPDKLSMMPEGLMSVLTKEEVLDLLAYLRSGGKKEDPAFSKAGE